MGNVRNDSTILCVISNGRHIRVINRSSHDPGPSELFLKKKGIVTYRKHFLCFSFTEFDRLSFSLVYLTMQYFIKLLRLFIEERVKFVLFSVVLVAVFFS